MAQALSSIRILAGTSILVAETELIARTSLSELFRDEGCRVLEAADSGAAIGQISNAAELDVVLLDLLMPSKFSVIKHSHAKSPGALLIGMALDPMSGNEAEQMGLHGHLMKPISFDYLCKLISRLMGGRPIT